MIDIKWFNCEFYPSKRTGRAVRYEDGVLPRMREPHTRLFTPWGPRYDWETRGQTILPEDRELKTLAHLASLFTELQKQMPEKTWEWIFLAADTYGTRVNNLPTQVVQEYFASLKEWLAQYLPHSEFQLWSELETEALPLRNQAAEYVRTNLPYSIRERAAQTAQKMGRGSNPNVYLEERVTEALFIEQRYSPVKISCAPRNKDDAVDVDLPRLYLLPEALQVPWLKP